MRLATVIETILSDSQAARDSDNELIVQVLQRQGANLTMAQQETIKAMSFESITRCRRKFQEQGKYMPSPGVAKIRRLKSYIVQQNAPGASPQRLEQLTSDVPDMTPTQLDI